MKKEMYMRDGAGKARGRPLGAVCVYVCVCARARVFVCVCMQAGKGVGTSVSRLWTGNARLKQLFKTAVCFPGNHHATDRYAKPAGRHQTCQ